MANDIFQKDLFRYYGPEKENLRQRLLRPNELKYIYYFRKASTAKSKLANLYWRFRMKRMSNKTHIQIPYTTKIGEGFYIGHSGKVVINCCATLGKNINIASGVTIGQTNRGPRKGFPTIKDNCWIGTNAVVVGDVTIGSDVLIAPLAYVNFDVPDHSIVIGNPGKIIPCERATEGYVCRTV